MESARKLVSTLPRPLLHYFTKFPPVTASSTTTTVAAAAVKNPFIGSKSTKTGKWHEPCYSTRRAQQIYKMALDYNLSHLLPERQPHKAGTKETATMKGLVRWKGTKAERTFDDRKEAIQVKLQEAKDVMRGRRKARARKVRAADRMR